MRWRPLNGSASGRWVNAEFFPPLSVSRRSNARGCQSPKCSGQEAPRRVEQTAGDGHPLRWQTTEIILVIESEEGSSSKEASKKGTGKRENERKRLVGSRNVSEKALRAGGRKKSNLLSGRGKRLKR